jgi:Hg(II)-responsive transcriptional regulator
MRTGEVARRAAVNVETLRFYERRGILPEPPRRESGYREYPPETVDLIRFIKRAQELGFSLEEVRELLDLRRGRRRATGKVPQLVKSKIAEIEHKIHDLEAMREALCGLLGACEKKGSRDSCPIIESLSGCPLCEREDSVS